MVRIAIIVASCPISFQVGARVVFKMLAPIRNPRASENEWPNSNLLCLTAEAERPGVNTSARYIFKALAIPMAMTTIARN